MHLPTGNHFQNKQTKINYMISLLISTQKQTNILKHERLLLQKNQTDLLVWWDLLFSKSSIYNIE